MTRPPEMEKDAGTTARANARRASGMVPCTAPTGCRYCWGKRSRSKWTQRTARVHEAGPARYDEAGRQPAPVDEAPEELPAWTEDEEATVHLSFRHFSPFNESESTDIAMEFHWMVIVFLPI